jgi:hypothetical protein
VLTVVLGLCTTLACICFGFLITTISVFSFIPYYAAGLLITAFIILIFVAFKPWKPGFFKKNANIYLAFVLVFMFIFFWVLVALTRDVCITSSPDSVSVYQSRKIAGDACAKVAPKPCHTYLTFGTNASTTVIVHFHTSKEMSSPVVRYSVDQSLSSQVVAVGIKMDLEVKRWVYYAELDGLSEDTTYFLIAGDGADENAFSEMKKVRTAKSSGSFSFVSGGDLGMSPKTPTLVKNAATLEPLYMALGGDLAYANAMRSCYPRWDAFLSMYETNAVTPTGYTVPIVAAVGNHEAGGFNQPLSHLPFYTRYFVQESLNGRLPQDLPTYHVKYISNQVLVSLDSSVIKKPLEQVDWLTSTLSAAPPGSFKSAIYHAPGYPSIRSFEDPESKSVRQHFVPVFDDQHLHVSFENHDHAYKRTKRLKASLEDPTGTLYVGDGAMGVSPRISTGPQPIPSGKDYLTQFQGRSFFLYVSITDATYTMAALDETNAIFDGFSDSYF